MTYEQILETALRQSAADLCCRPEDLTSGEKTLCISGAPENARKYLSLPFDCNFVSYGKGVVASVSPAVRETAAALLERFEPYTLFETPNLLLVQEEMRAFGLLPCFMAEYFLPRPELIRPTPCRYELRELHAADFSDLYLPQWSNALCEKRKELDVLGVGAYENGSLIALAACSADCEDMWQIGVDVLPEHRGEGLSTALTTRLALKILEQKKVPFYCAAWSNLRSVRNAVSSGFRPAWVELTLKPEETVRSMIL